MKFHMHNGSIPNNEYRELGYAIRDVSMMIVPKKNYNMDSDYHPSLTASDIHTIENTIELLKDFLKAIKGE